MGSTDNKKLWAQITNEIKITKKPAPATKVTSNNAAFDSELFMAAIEASIAQDQLKEAETKARKLKTRLYSLMQYKNIEAIAMPDRGDIEIKKNISKKTTKKSLTEDYGPELANFIWGLFSKEEYSYLSIPKKNEPDEPENV